MALVMTMAQQFSDARPNYAEGCGPLQDFGFDFIPELSTLMWDTQTDYSNIADVWIAASYVLFLFVLVPFALKDPMLVVTRFLWCMSYGFAFRTATVFVTRYPRLPFKSPNYRPENVLWGAVLIVLGARTTATDMMFSAHTFGWFMTASFVSRYSYYRWWSWIYWLFNLTGVFLLISVREHYTSDVVVGAVVAKLVFWVYHLALDDEYLRFIRPGLSLDAPHNTQVALPALLTDALGKRVRVEPEAWHDHLYPAHGAATLAEDRHLSHDHRTVRRRARATHMDVEHQAVGLEVVDVMTVPNSVMRDAVMRRAGTEERRWVPVVSTGQYYRYLGPRAWIYWLFKWLDGSGDWYIQKKYITELW